MVDFKVMDAQKWVNKTYQGQQGYIRIAEDGITGWDTIHALIRALQIELGIPGDALSDNFGPQTLAKLTARGGTHVEDGWGLNPFFIVQSALFCKGYDAGAIDGQWGIRRRPPFETSIGTQTCRFPPRRCCHRTGPSGPENG